MGIASGLRRAYGVLVGFDSVLVSLAPVLVSEAPDFDSDDFDSDDLDSDDFDSEPGIRTWSRRSIRTCFRICRRSWRRNRLHTSRCP